jgi:NACalpha-BTF3-like transcription factor
MPGTSNSTSAIANTTQRPVFQPEIRNRDLSDISSQDLELLVNMGFTQDQAIFALRESNYNVQDAAQFLLERC